MHHDGSITHLEFQGKSHMMSAGEDGKLCLWRTKDWESLKSFRGIKTACTSFAIHPSGRLALSISADKKLKCWDLVKAINAFTAVLDRGCLLAKPDVLELSNKIL
jgi:protein MAK11